MKVVTDFSASFEILLKKDKCIKFKEELAKAAWVIAPDLYYTEIANVFWK